MKKKKIKPQLFTEAGVASASIKVAGQELTPEAILILKDKLKKGELAEIVFSAEVWINRGNENGYRFYEDELEEFGSSFKGCPFCVDHNTRNIESRHGIIREAEYSSGSFVQEIAITTSEGMEMFLDRRLDRFSIGWKYDDIICSICQTDWYECNHWVGDTYEVGPEKVETVCELYFTNPRGRETSAVTDPAVEGTRVLSVLEEHKKHMENQEEAVLTQVEQVEQVAQVEQVEQVTEERLPEWLTLALASQPEGVQKFVIAQCTRHLGREKITAKLVNELLESAQAMLSSAHSASPRALSNTPRIQGHQPVVSGMSTVEDKIRNAWEWHLGSNEAKRPSKFGLDLRQLYLDTTGDYGWYGVANPVDSVLAAGSTIALPGIVADAMNKVVIQLWDSFEVYRWYEQLVTVQPNNGTLHDMKWVRFGGISNLPTVQEGAAYQEKTLTDSSERSAFAKRGAYVGITLEMFRNNDVVSIQEIPRALVRAALRTRSASIASLFTMQSGLGPTLTQDNTTLFHANHNNLAATAFSHDAWKAARVECATQSELGSGSRTAVWPKYCLVPINMYDVALETFGYGKGDIGRPLPLTTNQVVNIYAQGRSGDPRPVPVAVPDWTNTANWAYLADRNMTPVIHMSYSQSRSGREHPKPEIFSASNQKAGLMFSNDISLAVKIRELYAFGVSGPEGVGKRNVA